MITLGHWDWLSNESCFSEWRRDLGSCQIVLRYPPALCRINWLDGRCVEYDAEKDFDRNLYYAAGHESLVLVGWHADNILILDALSGSCTRVFMPSRSDDTGELQIKLASDESQRYLVVAYESGIVAIQDLRIVIWQLELPFRFGVQASISKGVVTVTAAADPEERRFSLVDGRLLSYTTEPCDDRPPPEWAEWLKRYPRNTGDH